MHPAPPSPSSVETSAPAPQVSVLIPCYNTARYLRQAVESVQQQTFQDFEIVLLNDGSTDEMESVFHDLQSRDPRIRTHSRENRGLIDTRNELVAMARADLIAWHDSDDTVAPRKLEWQVARFRAEPDLVWLGGACTWTDPDGRPIWTHSFPCDHDSIVHRMVNEDVACYFGSVMMRRQIVNNLGGFRHPFAIGEDYDLCLRMAEVGRVANLPDVTQFYRQHLKSTVNQARAKTQAYSQLVRQLAAERRNSGHDRLQRGEKIDVTFGDLPSTRENRLETHRRWAWWALRSGNLDTARKYALQSIADAPLDKESWKLMACALRGR